MKPPSLTLFAAYFLSFPISTTLGAPIQFLVGEPSSPQRSDSYVILIDEQDEPRLQRARALVAWVEAGADLAFAPDDRIVWTEIAAGANGINRNLLAPGEPTWSWHPIGTPDFVSFTIEILDGWPSFVESDVDGWMANTGGAIGFWGYTVTREIGPVPEPNSVWLLLLGASLFVLGKRRNWRESWHAVHA